MKTGDMLPFLFSNEIKFNEVNLHFNNLFYYILIYLFHRCLTNNPFNYRNQSTHHIC